MQRVCAQPWCRQPFEITAGDLEFYEKISPVFNGRKEIIPPPTLCPECRQQRRWAVRNENHLYRHTCSLTGKAMISLYAPDTPYKVLCEEAYRGNQWDPMAYGRPYDFSRPFFDQFHELLLAVPRRGLMQDETNENCEFITYGGNNKNCYMTHGCMFCQDVYHSTRCGYLHDASDCYHTVSGELLYECINSTNCYQCAFCQDVNNCQDSLLLDHCQACKHCIACKNLRGKEYYIYNQPMSEEQYHAFRSVLYNSALDQERAKFDIWKKDLPYPHAHLLQSENCTGDYLNSARNCSDCFVLHMSVEDCRYCQCGGMQMRDMMDGTMVGMGDLIYEGVGIGPVHQGMFLVFGEHVHDVMYCTDLLHCSRCFGCTGLNHKDTCIFNRQYTKEEYEDLVPRILSAMRSTGEYGEFFPMRISTFPYSDTIAQEWFPLSASQAQSLGLRWQEEQSSVTATAGEDICICTETGKQFKITRQEHALCARMELPLPTLHPSERHRRRIARCNPFRLWTRECAKCHRPITTSYAPERPEIVYCESCYLKEVY
ncbi:MAG: hypothetical protein V1926_01390 [Candidatus Peregrinibacteria bacterium]